MLEVVGATLLIAGAIFMLVGSIGVLRLPDFYARTHAATNVDTLGIFLFVVGLAVKEGASLLTIKLAFVAVFILLVNPVGTHALASSALNYGLKPWFRGAGSASREPDGREES
ncbi:MAG: monovalent cation/H(+) antiporter subunit G [Planctomycetota bacterium]